MPPQPVVEVNLVQFYCEDQAHYLVEFLSRVGYSKERSMRSSYTMVAKSAEALASKTFPRHTVFLLMANVSLAYHGYWDSEMIDNRRVLWFPLGVRRVFPRILPTEIPPSADRPYVFNLIISLSTSHTRQELADIARGLNHHSFIHTISEWNKDFVGYLGPQEYKEKLLHSIFTLSPSGHNVECYRIYEACDAGSIPIIEDVDAHPGVSCKDSLAPFKNSNAPFIYLKNWKDLPDLLDQLLQDPEWIFRRQIELLEWNRKFKLAAISDFENRLAQMWGLQ